jgi:hypothetical protein
MKTNSELIIDQEGIELEIDYRHEDIEQFEEGHGQHDLSYTDIELKHVWLTIKGKPIDIFPLLNADQEEHLISLLNNY